MSYSKRNRAWDRLQVGQAQQRVEEEKALAAAIAKACPTMTWGKALSEAVRIVRKHESAPLGRQTTPIDNQTD